MQPAGLPRLMAEEPPSFARFQGSQAAKRWLGKCGFSGKNAFILTQVSRVDRLEYVMQLVPLGSL